MMIRTTLLTLICVSVGGCASMPFSRSGPVAPAIAVQPAGDATARPQPRPNGTGGQTPDALDQTTAEDRARASAGRPASANLLGATLASLGSPAEQGFWLRTGLVTRVQPGRVELDTGGASLQVELRPSGAAPDAGSQLSLAAFRALDMPLTQLLRLQVFAQ